MIHNLQHFNNLFSNNKFQDDFGWLPEWNEEIEKWLTFIDQKDHDYYETHKRRAQSDKQRNELLGEYKAAYFIGKKSHGEILAFEPRGNGTRKLDFRFKDKDGIEWFVEVKSPSWRNQVVREVEQRFLRDLRGRIIFNGVNPNNFKNWQAEITCPLCNGKMNFEIETLSLDDNAINDTITNLICSSCKKHIWKSLEQQRVQEINNRVFQPQHITGEARSFDGSEGVEDAIKSCIAAAKFEKGKNNLLIVTPNMFTESALLMAGFDDGHRVKQLLQKYDKEGVITCVVILEVSLPIKRDFAYTNILIPKDDTKPSL